MRSIDTPWEKDEVLFLGQNYKCLVEHNGDSCSVFYNDIKDIYQYYGDGLLLITFGEYIKFLPSRAVFIKNGNVRLYMIISNYVLSYVMFGKTKRNKLISIRKNRDNAFALTFKQKTESDIEFQQGEVVTRDGHEDNPNLRNFSYYEKLFGLYENLLKEKLDAIH